MIALAFWHRLGEVMDGVTQGDEPFAVGLHDGIVEPQPSALDMRPPGWPRILRQINDNGVV
jgi:hypothetical protein